jgi:hypothetical protein
MESRETSMGRRSGHARGDVDQIRSLAAQLAASSHEVLARIRDAKGELRPAAGPLIAFVHVPKTAGASVKSMFARAFSIVTVTDAGNYLRDPEAAVVRVSSGRITKGRVAVGHIPYGLFRAHLPGDTRYMTFLRDPVNRVLSHYHGHLRRTPRTERVRSVTAASLKEAIELRLPEISNLATRLLSDDPSPMEALPASALDQAKANLREFEFVGVTERFDESIVLMQRVLGLPPVLYESQHVSRDRPSIEEITEEERRLIQEMNELDLELYSFARGLFEERASAAAGDVADEAGALGRRSAIADERARAELQNALGWLEERLPPGTRRPVASLRDAAGEAGISAPSLRRAAKLLDARLERAASGERRWVRPDDAART